MRSGIARTCGCIFAVVGFAGAVGTLLAAIDSFGVVSYTVTRQTREIGIRMAVGATVPRVRRMVLGRSARLTVTGVVREE